MILNLYQMCQDLIVSVCQTFLDQDVYMEGKKGKETLQTYAKLKIDLTKKTKVILYTITNMLHYFLYDQFSMYLLSLCWNFTKFVEKYYSPSPNLKSYFCLIDLDHG